MVLEKLETFEIGMWANGILIIADGDFSSENGTNRGFWVNFERNDFASSRLMLIRCLECYESKRQLGTL